MSTRCAFMSRRPSSNTANSPHGPAPIISTSVLIASFISWTLNRHDRACPACGPEGSSAQRRPGHPRLLAEAFIDVDGRDKPGYDENGSCQADFALVRAHSYGDMHVNAPTDIHATPLLEDFPYRLTDNVRF